VRVAQANDPSTSMEAVGLVGDKKGKKVSLAAMGLGCPSAGFQIEARVDEGTSLNGPSSCVRVSAWLMSMGEQSQQVKGGQGPARKAVGLRKGLGVASTCSREPIIPGFHG
jgi:hypothetical protein